MNKSGVRDMLHHINSSLSKLKQMLEVLDEGESNNENNWATTTTAPRLLISNAREVINNKLKKIVPPSPPVPDESTEENLVYNQNVINLLAVLLSIITSIVTMLTAVLPKIIQMRQKVIESPPLPSMEISKGKKRGRERKDVLADIDGSNIVIITSKQLPTKVDENSFVVNINEDFKKFSTRYAHMNIPIPYMTEHLVGHTVTGIWQGLQVYKDEDVDKTYMSMQGPRIPTRRPKDNIIGWKNGLRGSINLPLVEARKKLLLHMFKYLLEHRLEKEYKMIKDKREKEGKKIIIVCEGNESGDRIENENEIFGAAGVIKYFLLHS